MSDRTQSIHSLKGIVRDFINERQWNIGENPKDMVMSVAIEAAELMEIFQWKTSEEALKIADSGEFEHMREELADVLIYCIRIANMLDLDIYDMVAEKMQKNAVKYPVIK